MTNLMILKTFIVKINVLQYWKYRRVFWYNFNQLSDESTPTILRVEDGTGTFVVNNDKYLSDFMELYLTAE